MNRIAVILWLYHTDLWPEFFTLLQPLSNRIHLYLGLHDIDKNNLLFEEIKQFDKITINHYENYGADVAPFMNQLQLVSEPVFVKIHSKKSMIGNKNNIRWRSILLHSLVGSQNILDNNTNLLLSTDSIQMLAEPNLITSNREGNNSPNIEQLCKIIDLDYSKMKNRSFVMGNMFSAKTSVFREIFDKPNTAKILSLLSKEKGKVNDLNGGTYTHALERLFGYICNIGHIEPPSILIKNSIAPNGFFHMVKMYDSYCYLKEDINVCGKILEDNDKQYVIEWYHMEDRVVQTYCVIDNNIRLVLEKC